MARGTTGAPRNARVDTIEASELGAPGAAPDGVRGTLGRLAGIVCGRRSKFLVVAFWILVIAATGSFAGKLQGAEKNDASAYLPASAESTQELNAQDVFQSKNLNPAVVVYVRSSGVTGADLAKARADARQFAALPAVRGHVTGPAVSRDHKAIETVIGADLGYNADLSGFVNGVKSTAAGDPGLTAYVAGPAANAADEVKVFKGIDSTLLYATLAVVVVLLLLTYRSPVLWLLPILSAGIALTAAEAVIYWLTQHANLTVNGQSGGILVVLVIGAGTDYALLLIARYREELRRHTDRHEAMAVALRRAGPAIIASGLTVVAGMLCLLAAESNDISGLGPVAAIGIGVGLIAMITLLPALLVVFGRWIFWPARPGYGTPEPTSRGIWSRVGGALARQPRAVWLVTAVLLGAGAAGLAGFHFGALTVAQSFRGSPFVFVFLVALGIDYNIFLMTRVREESVRAGTRRGALTGLAATGGVITSAGLVLAGTFAMLATLPLVEFTEIGFAVALGVLMDTIIVRSVLVTSLTLDIGRHTWWPSSLSRARTDAL